MPFWPQLFPPMLYATSLLPIVPLLPTYRGGHRIIAAVQFIPVVGILASLIERIVVLICKTFLSKQRKSTTVTPSIDEEDNDGMADENLRLNQLSSDSLAHVAKFLDTSDTDSLSQLTTGKKRIDRIWQAQVSRLNLNVPVGVSPQACVVEHDNQLIDFCQRIPGSRRYMESQLAALNLHQKAEALRKWLSEDHGIAGRTELNLDFSEIKAIPPEIKFFKNLNALRLKGNGLSSLPAEIGHLTELVELDLNHNQLTSLPPEIGKLAKLIGLNIEHNELASLPSEFFNLSNLEEFSVANNKLSVLSPEIGRLTKLQQLGLHYNRLTSLPAEIGNLTKLTGLAVAFKQLNSLPPEIGRLVELEDLIISNNKLRFLPLELNCLNNLMGLIIKSNQLTSLPPIGNLTKLQRFSVADNQLPSLPPEIGNLANLEELVLNDNQFTCLPPEIGNLANLRELWAFGNQLTSLPNEVGNLSELTLLHVDPQTTIPVNPPNARIIR